MSHPRICFVETSDEELRFREESDLPGVSGSAQCVVTRAGVDSALGEDHHVPHPQPGTGVRSGVGEMFVHVQDAQLTSDTDSMTSPGPIPSITPHTIINISCQYHLITSR